MDNTHYNGPLTLKLYLLAAVVFGIYGGRVCPMLATLTFTELFTHVTATFGAVYLIRHFFLRHHSLVIEQKHAQLDSTLMFFGSLILAAFYNLLYDFPLDSNLKVLFGMTLFGFFTGLLLQLDTKISSFSNLTRHQRYQFELSGKRQSMVKQMILLISLLLVALTSMLAMVAIKDIFWLKHNPERVLDGTGVISVIKEFIYISFVLGGYVIAIMVKWSKLMRLVLRAQEFSLIEVANGNISTRVPVFEHNELGSMASLTNQMLDSLESSQDEVCGDCQSVGFSRIARQRNWSAYFKDSRVCPLFGFTFVSV